jgi:hypothetical protein
MGEDLVGDLVGKVELSGHRALAEMRREVDVHGCGWYTSPGRSW